MTTVLLIAVGVLVGVPVLLAALLALGLWIRTRRAHNRGLAPARSSVIDTNPLPRIHQEDT